MNTQENNKLIAEFMGARPVTFNGGTKGHTFWNDDVTEGRYGSFPNGATNYFEYDKGYHTSWDWLMPVIQKCLIGEAEHSEDVSNLAIKNIYEGICNQDISLAYESVVEFINKYNKNK